MNHILRSLLILLFAAMVLGNSSAKTVTPLSTDAQALRDLLSDPACEIACYLGIEPGVTTRSEVEAIFDEPCPSYGEPPCIAPTATPVPHQQSTLQDTIIVTSDFYGDPIDVYGISMSDGELQQVYTNVVADLIHKYINGADCATNPNTMEDEIVFTISQGIYTTTPTNGAINPIIDSGGVFSTASTSQDGTLIIFDAILTGNQGKQLYSIDATGENLTQITDLNLFPLTPDISPDSQKIAFAYEDNDQFGLATINVDGTEFQMLTQGTFLDDAPTWSPDGQSIAFHSDRAGNMDIFVINVATGQMTQLTSDQGNNIYPIWSPDGTQIAFSSDREGLDFQVYTMNVDGTDQTRITSASFDNRTNITECWIQSSE